MTFTTNQVGANSDYMQYVSGPIVKTDKINTPDLLDFSLVNFNGAMVKLSRGSHIVLTTSTYGVWFSGFITNDPELTYQGTKGNVPQWGYNYEAAGEEYMLNQKPFGIVAPFINTTQGAILTFLINLLTPSGMSFDTSGIQPGQSVPRFIVDPNKHFTEIVTDFAKSANYQFRCQNFVATYAQQDTITTGFAVDGNSQHFTPSSLSMKAAGDPIINDSIVLGAIEPQNYMHEYFAGDGATAQFNLISSVFGVDSTLLLDDDMSSSSIDSTKWTVYDSSANYLLPYGGALNVVGGNSTNTLDVSLQSASLLPIEGNLRLTHGEWDFIGGAGGNDGVVGGLWTGQTTQIGSAFPGCLSGIRVLPVGTGSGAGTILYPVANGVVDTSQSVTVNYNLRYVMRTLITSNEAKRNAPTFSYRSVTGVVHTISVPMLSDHFYATTVITELDPITAAMTNQWTWTNDLGSVAAVYGYYVPVASNNLHLTVQSVTVSVPMQASLNHQVAGSSIWEQQIIGPNMVDTLDGMAPAATIVDSNNGAQTRNSLLGSANYNPGQASLTYFKETAQLKSYLPSAGDLIHLSYRGAGAAIGRARSKASIATESAAWGDDGVRSETKRDFKPLPLTSVECQMAAVARVSDNCYQHWSGTYTMPSGSWFTSQPLSGTLIPFRNLPAQFPSYLSAETITEVRTTLDSLNPVERFTHEISFGPTSSVQNVLAAIKNTNDVFTPQDTAEIPQFIDVTSLGNTSVQSVPKFLYSYKDANYWYFTFVDTLPASIMGIEIRYTDSGWGASAGNNLISRISFATGFPIISRPLRGIPSVANGFAIPRTVRGKVAFLRCFDQRNLCTWSEDITQHASKDAGITTSLVKAKGPNNSYQMISHISSSSAAASQRLTTANPLSGVVTLTSNTFTVSVLGPVGNQIKVGFAGNMNTVTCTGFWQRVSVTASTSSVMQPVITPVTLGATFSITQMSLEATTQETIYCKSESMPYGTTSMFSTGLHTAFPMIPPAPTGVIDYSQIDAPLVSVILPSDLTDVWGCEIRAADNMTVLFHTDLVNATLTIPTFTGDTSMVLSQTCPALPKRAYSYWLYTYNLFGEYSVGYNLTGTITPPTVTNLNVLNSEMMVVWTGSNARAFDVYVDLSDDTLQNLSVSVATSSTFYQLTSDDFFGLRYIAITPYDALGPGETVGAYFQYLPDAMTGLTTGDVASA